MSETEREDDLLERVRERFQIRDAYVAVHEEEIAAFVREESDRACKQENKQLRQWLADAAAEIPCAGTVQHRIQMLKKQHGNDIQQAVEKEREEAAQRLRELVEAALLADWLQVVLNGGPPCFAILEGRFCLRAMRWEGHRNGSDHSYVTLAEAIRARGAKDAG